MNLNNSLPVPPVPTARRLCYWHPDYQMPEPFCKTSKQSKAEKLLELEEMEKAIFANQEPYQIEADEDGERVADHVEADEDFIFDCAAQKRLIRARNFEQAFHAFEGLLQENNVEKKGFGLYNIQTIGGAPPLRTSTARELAGKYLSR